MRRAIYAVIGFLSVCLMVPAAMAQQILPENRYILTQDMDFFGADRTALFDTTVEACRRACSADDQCVAFTFNTRSNACFPKSAITDRQPYAGAQSAVRVRGDAAQNTTAAQRAAALGVSEDDIEAARILAARMGFRFAVNEQSLEALIEASRAAWQRGERAVALRRSGAAVALSDAPDVWARYAYIAQRLGENVPSRQRRDALQEAVPAALNAYLRAKTVGGQATALQTYAEALERNGRGREMIGALRLAQALQPRDDIAAALTGAIGKYGFRVVETQVDNNSAAPRICTTFSEDLVQAGVDYEPFVRTDTQGLVVDVDARTLCVDGVRHGERYRITLRSGLPAASGETLNKDITLTQYVRDRAPVVRFPGRSYVLPRGAGASIPVETVNLDTVALTLARVSDRNLVQAMRRDFFGRPMTQWQADQFNTDIAEVIWEGSGDVENTLNTEMRTLLPLGDVLADQAPGIYVLTAKRPGSDSFDTLPASQWFVLSDLGISSWQGTDGLTAAVRALGDASAVEGAEVSLISQANAILGTARTDADGFVQFEAGLTRGRGAATPTLLQVETGDDFVFLPLSDPAFDLSDRGVEGRPPAPPVDVFLTTDRGAYRPGATIYATALVRDAKVGAINGLPLTAILFRPDGVEYARIVSTQGRAGGHVMALPVATTAPRGTWRIEVMGDVGAPPLASQTVLVEDFIPDRIEVDLNLPEGALRIGAPTRVAVGARYLFGAPGADLVVEGDVRVQRRNSVTGWPGYFFGRHDAQFSPQRVFFDGGRTDAAGQADVALTWPDVTAEGVLLEAITTVRVSDSGGRPVERSLTRPIASTGMVIGIRPGFEDVLPENGTARFDLVALGGAAVRAQWTVNKVETRYQWYQLFGNWNWEPTTRRTRVAQGEITLGSEPQSIEVPTEWGDYEVVVETVEGAYAASSVSFAAGWYGGTDSSSTPDRLTLSLDAARYRIGDTAQLRVVPGFDGVALVSVLSNGVIARQVVPVVAGENVIPLDVTEDWGTGAYVTASALRGSGEGFGPGRVLGLAHAAIDPGAKALSVSIEAPLAVDGQPGSTDVEVRVDGLEEATGYVTLAAVDVGVLNLTGFDAPDPQAHYFGQRRLGVDLRDMYGRLIDGRSGATGTVRSGGDAGAAMQRQGPPPTEAVMAAFSGPVEVGPDGVAVIPVPRPNFNGTIRLMAMAWSNTGVGQANADMVARDPVVISAAVPRFLAPGDRSRVMLEFVHATGDAGAMTLAVDAEGVILGSAPDQIEMSTQGTVRVAVPVTADAVGDHSIRVALTTPDGTVLRKALTLGVRANDPIVATTRRFSLDAGAALTFDDNVLADLHGSTARATLAAGPLARFDMPGLLRQLDRYPYGCTEQVTSAALPLLYAPQVAGAAGIDDIKPRVDQAIARVLTRQASNGAFGLWQAQAGEFWLDAYVTDFLTRAQEQGYNVPARAVRLALDNLRNRINYAPDFDAGGEDIAYALMVLARSGAASIGDLRYYADTKGTAFATPLARAQLGAALASYGEQTRADRMFGLAGDMAVNAGPGRQQWRDDFGTPLRDAAGVLHLAAEVGSTAVNRATLASAITAQSGQYSTQEAAQVLMAAQALRSGTGPASLTVDDVPVAGPLVQSRGRGDAVSIIRNVSGAAQDVTLTTYGVPLTPPEAGGYGYQIIRAAFTLEGTPVEGPWAVGERRVIVLRVTPFEEVGARLMVDDPLPAGIEIDNPTLIRSGDVSGFDWLSQAPVQHVEFRADRFLAAVDQRGADAFELAYIARAVSPGTFHHPAALVEDMYRPEYRAITATGETVVTE
ncbi:alpha-2-macroglobulin family protein [uncultured Tateyamaria sp.]|uniref:alpha-2-macroglobulin family protein n=1 Tax=uncultured Tateyamaria sp. TaxID=455651 RepID=UPI00262E8638|nr:alpha-2-macroglobulin family protein [uncultured Tateyamaria sp.]